MWFGALSSRGLIFIQWGSISLQKSSTILINSKDVCASYKFKPCMLQYFSVDFVREKKTTHFCLIVPKVCIMCIGHLKMITWSNRSNNSNNKQTEHEIKESTTTFGQNLLRRSRSLKKKILVTLVGPSFQIKSSFMTHLYIWPHTTAWLVRFKFKGPMLYLFSHYYFSS